MRLWGLIVSAAVISAGVAIAALGGCSPADTPSPQSAEAVAAPSPTPASSAMPGEEALVAEAAEAPPPRLLADGGTPQPRPPVQAAQVSDAPSFLVRFASPHEMARAQRVAASGDIAYARVLAVQAIRAHPEMRGLCYGGFTLGGAEVILEACIATAEPTAFHRRWQARLNRMRHVTYAEPNLIAQPSVGR